MTEQEKTSLIKAEEFEGIIEILLEKLPEFIDEITKALANEKFVERFGLSVSQFYFSLKQKGMDDNDALLLTKEYIHTFNIGAIVKGLGKIEDIRKILTFFEIKSEVK